MKRIWIWFLDSQEGPWIVGFIFIILMSLIPEPIESEAISTCRIHEGMVYYFDAGTEVNVLCGDDTGFTMNKKTRAIVYEADEESYHEEDVTGDGS